MLSSFATVLFVYCIAIDNGCARMCGSAAAPTASGIDPEDDAAPHGLLGPAACVASDV